MNRFAALLDRLSFTPQRNAKIALIADYMASAPDLDRGWALAALTGGLDFRYAKPAVLRALAAERVDEQLFALSYDYVGDLAETLALIWPAAAGANAPPTVSEIVERLSNAGKAEVPGLLRGWLDAMDATERWALLKLITGGLRVGVSARLVKVALAQMGDAPVQEIEELWHGLEAPYTELFAWLEGRGEKPENAAHAPFRPVMLAHALVLPETEALPLEEFSLEWKWDGIRVQAVGDRGTARLYSRTGDDISAAFPDILEALDFQAALDGELLVYRPQAEENGYVAAPFSDLQQRLNRKTTPKKLLETHPAFLRAYDLLEAEGEDLRPLPFEDRRRRLEAWFEEKRPARMDLSPIVAAESWAEVDALRASPPLPPIEGLMAKRKASPYTPGRPKGHWFKWKKDPHLIDAVLMYAQRGHGKRSSFYSDYTFGVWRDGEEGEELVPVGKAYFGFTDEELKTIDKFVRANTKARFGPVREVAYGSEQGLVLEVAFEGLNRSPRHKSGLAMRFPRIHRLRWDKPPREADRIEALEKLLPQG
ncbi:MAG: cisplatin damage response ATP-dependent DNA ligase [Pseudomonadota bacterium]